MSSEPKQTEEMTLENLCVDCLEEIFRYLPLPDLLNVADSSKSLRTVAGLAFSFKHGKSILRITGFTSRIRNYYNTLTVITADIKFMFRLMRCFGHLVSRMEVVLQHKLIDNMKLFDTNFECLMLYVTEYCIESLTDFTLLGVELKGSLLDHFVKPFPNVHSVCVQSPVSTTISLTELFPKMRRLTYNCVKMEELLSIRSDLQRLDHLEIKNGNIYNEWNNWEEWESWNPLLQQSILQLRSLSLSYNIIFPNMLSFAPFLNLQELKLNAMPIYIENEAKFYSKTVKKFSICYPSTGISSFPVIPFSFANLEILDLEFHAYNTSMLESSPEPFYDFISSHPNILKLRIYKVPGLLSLHRLMTILPLLDDVELVGIFAANDVIQFLNGMKALKVLLIESNRGQPKTREIANINDRPDRLKARWHCEKYDIVSYKFTRISEC